MVTNVPFTVGTQYLIFENVYVWCITAVELSFGKTANNVILLYN
jgi:hypothetical protein